MAHVSGIGGFFFRAADPRGLAAWYEQRLGIPLPAKSYDELPWRQEAGSTVFHPFPADTTYFGDSGRSWMLNFRVRDLDGLVSALRSAGERVELDPTIYPNGRFARLVDGEGNPLQLWEPGGVDPG